MSAKKLRAQAATKQHAAPPSDQVIPASSAERSYPPPRPSRWQLVVSSILMAAWLIFLAWMAFAD